MGVSASKSHGGAARADQGWLARSLSRSWSMPPIPSLSYGGGRLYGKSPEEIKEEEEEEEEEGGGEVIDPIKPMPRARENDAWEIVEETPVSSSTGKPRKRARSYSKSVSLPHSSTHSSRSIDLVHGLPLVLEEEESPSATLLQNSCDRTGSRRPALGVRRGLFCGASLEELATKHCLEDSPRNRGSEMVSSPSSSLEDWCIVGPRKMERLDDACGGISRKSSGNCLRDKTNFVDHRGLARQLHRDHLSKDQIQQQEPCGCDRPRKEEEKALDLQQNGRDHRVDCKDLKHLEQEHQNLQEDHHQLLDLKHEQQQQQQDLLQEHGCLLDRFERKCPPGGDNRVVLYVTSLQGIRKTYEQCRAVRTILEASFARIDERDVAMHAEFRRELRDLVGATPVPRLFVKGRHIGGAEEVMQLNENGLLRDLLDGLPREKIRGRCEGCGGARFVPCMECGGSCKVVAEVGGGGRGGGDGCYGNEMFVRCRGCNENGLVRCPLCY